MPGRKTERVAIALGECDRVGERLGGEEENLLLFGVVGHSEADVGEEGSREHRDAVARDELVGRGDRVRRLAAVVLADHLELLAVDAARRVDLVEGELPALAVGLGEGGDRRVGVDFADLDRVVGDGWAGASECGGEDARLIRLSKTLSCSMSLIEGS